MFVFVSATVYKEEFPEKPNRYLWYMSELATSWNVCAAK